MSMSIEERQTLIMRMSRLVNGDTPMTQAERDYFDNLDAKLDADLQERSGNAANVIGDTRASSERTESDREFTNFLRSGAPGASAETETRDGQTTQPGAGGYTIPQAFWNKLVTAQKLYGGLSQYFAQVETDAGNEMVFPTINPTNIVGSYVTENTQVPDTTYTFGQGLMYAWTITSGVIKASLQLCQDSEVDIDSFVATRTGESIGRLVASEAVTGAGSASKALTGIIPSLTAVGTGQSSGGYFALGSATAVKNFGGTTTELAANVLAPQTAFKLIGSVDPAYWAGDCAFYMNTTQALNMREIVDANNRPLLNLDNAFANGATIGSIAGFPVRVANEIPNLTASTIGGPMFGDLGSAMVLRTVSGGRLMTLVERYADFLQRGYLAYVRMDSQPLDLRALVTVQAASS